MTGTAMTWNWTPPANTDLARVRVYLNNVYRREYLPGSVNTYGRSDLLPNTLYIFSTRAFDTSDNPSVWTNITNRTPKDSVPPGPVTNLHIVRQTSTSLVWNWTPPADRDFVTVRVYLNNVYRRDFPLGSVNMYGRSDFLPNTAYTFSTRAYRYLRQSLDLGQHHHQYPRIGRCSGSDRN